MVVRASGVQVVKLIQGLDADSLAEHFTCNLVRFLFVESQLTAAVAGESVSETAVEFLTECGVGHGVVV